MNKVCLNILLAALVTCAPIRAQDAAPPRMLIQHDKSGIRLSWNNSLTTDYQLLQFSTDLQNWNIIQVFQAATGTVQSVEHTERDRGFFHLSTVSRQALLGDYRNAWLYDPPDNQPPLKKLHHTLPEWDELMQNHPLREGEPPWITKQVLGKSSVGSYDIVRYDFTPVDPKKTVIITGSMHGIEWPSTDMLLRIFREITFHDNEHPIFGFLRNEVHFIVIPLVNPWGYVHNDRRCRETDPIPAHWERTGNIATVTIDETLFPDTGGRFIPQGYIEPRCAGKLVVSLQASSDQQALPTRGYKIETVIDPLRFTIQCEDMGSAQGTAEIYVLTDINRQFNINDWDAFSALGWADTNGVPHSNKGTRPYALVEAQYILDVLQTYSNAVAFLDFHTGPPAPYSAYYGRDDGVDVEPINVILDFLAPPAGEIAIGTNKLPSGNSYAAQVLGMQSFTPETGGSDATKSFRWWINILSGYSLLF